MDMFILRNIMNMGRFIIYFIILIKVMGRFIIYNRKIMGKFII